MGLFTKLVMLPLAPVAGVVWLAEQIEREADAQLRSPVGVRERLAALDEAEVRGEISAEERLLLEEALLAEVEGGMHDER
jgi:hypothetical protein